jgi:8-oxo-dGTP pyrophosphatase MutT (NUDIX family)
MLAFLDGDSKMVCANINGTVFMLRAGALCVEDGRLLICRTPGLPYWYLPGGRVHAGETLVEAIHREVVEEIGCTPVSAELAWLTENFFDHDGTPVHEIGVYFSVTLPRDAEALVWQDTITRIETGDEMELIWCWLPLGELAGIDLRPSFIAEYLNKTTTGITHIVHRG